MKRTEQLDPTQPVELTYIPEWNHGHDFTITGDYESLAPMAEAMIESDARTARVTRVSNKVGHSVLEAPKQAVSGLLGRIGMDVKARTFDAWNHTDLYGALQQKRHDEKVLGMARELGLITTTHCAKHERAIEELHKLG